MTGIFLIIAMQTAISAMVNVSVNEYPKTIKKFLSLCILPIAVYNAIRLVEISNSDDNLLDNNLF